ncbi:MAG: M28 family peptidase [Bacteroidota bacterium]
MRSIILGTLLLLYCSATNASDTSYARRVIDTLSSPFFWGRGYTEDGMKKTALYIEHEFEMLKTMPFFLGKYQQHFSYPVNTFPGKMALTINDKELKPGRDFLVGNESKSCKAKGSVGQADSVSWVNPQERIVINLVDKLTWNVDREQADYTSFKVLKTALGDAPKTFAATVDSKLLKSFDAANVAAMVKGTSGTDSVMVFTAHYDHLGGMGKDTYFPGANDNASGIGLMLSLAKYYAAHPQRYTIVFIAFAGEEAGLVGSKYFVEHPPLDIKKIRFLTNLDLMGNGEEGVTVVNATEFTKDFALLQKLNTEGNLLAAVNSRGKAANSDHHWFTEKGVPSFFIYTLGKRKCYHDVEDVAATLPNYELEDLQTLLVRFYDHILK